MYQPVDPMSPSGSGIDDERTPLLDARLDSSPSPPNGDADSGRAGLRGADGWTLDNTTRRLYVSHFLSTCNSRIFEFGSVLYLAAVFPGTLLPLSVYAMVRGASAIAFSSLVGHYIDREDRLKVVRLSIVSQRLVVAASCAVFYILARVQSASWGLRVGLLALLVLMACVEKLAAMMNLVSVERDWVVVVAKDDVVALRAMNSQMRRIDLLCKLMGPFFIGLIDGVSTETAILVNLGINCISLIVEYFSIAKVYHQVPELQRPKTIPNLTPEHSDQAQQPQASRIAQAVKRSGEGMALYFRHPAFMASFAGTLLYLTVLAFGGQMVTYLLVSGYTATQIASVRTVSVAFEVLATWIGPWLIGKIGPVRAGLWFSSWQLSCLAVGVSIFWMCTDNTLVSTLGLVGGTILSRVGLWGFDLSTQLIVQEEVEEEIRGAFSAAEASWQNTFEMCSYTLTVVFSSPELFRWPTTISVAAVSLAWALYTRFVRERRGHLIHWPACISHPEKRQRSTEDFLQGVSRRHGDGF